MGRGNAAEIFVAKGKLQGRCLALISMSGPYPLRSKRAIRHKHLRGIADIGGFHYRTLFMFGPSASENVILREVRAKNLRIMTARDIKLRRMETLRLRLSLTGLKVLGSELVDKKRGSMQISGRDC